MHRLIFLFILFFALAMIQACATAPKNVMRQDPLIGNIIKTQTSEKIDFNTLIKDIRNYDVIYLSEKHDNPGHHAIQQKIIRHLIKEGVSPVIGFEFFAMDHTPDLLNFMDSKKVPHSKKVTTFIQAHLRKKLGWDTQPDTLWGYYYDLLTLARTENIFVAGLDLSSALKKRITRKGSHDISPIEQDQVFSTHLADDAYKAYMFSIFKAVHCGMGNERMQSRLWDTWVARNDKMALSIVRLATLQKRPVVVIIGGGHTEFGLGVINRVAAIDNTLGQVNLAIKEIRVDPTPLADYLQPLELEGHKNIPPADYLWFTQRVSYADPCETFKDSLKKMRLNR